MQDFTIGRTLQTQILREDTKRPNFYQQNQGGGQFGQKEEEDDMPEYMKQEIELGATIQTMQTGALQDIAK